MRERSKAGMFGYVKALSSELKVKQYELYKSVYCGLCHHMKKRGRFITFSLSYDFVLPSLFALAFTEKEKISFTKKRCLAHPFKKRPAVDGGDAMQSVADAAVLLVYYKLLDDKNDCDTGFFKRIASAFALMFAGSARKRVLKARGETTDAVIKSKIAELSLSEKEKRESFYDGASIFEELLAEVFSQSVESEHNRRCLHEIGYRVGRWIYVADAIDDIEHDKKSGSYNPFIFSGEDTDSAAFRESIELALRLELAEGEKALDLIDISDDGLRAIIENILYLGMPDTIHRILYKDCAK